MLPTFLIAGVAKAGTTFLYRYLGEHPHTCMSAIKEPVFFSAEVGQDRGCPEAAPVRSGRFDKGLQWYESLFSHCNAGNARGEASGYLTRPDSSALISHFVPDVRLLFILRNPVDKIFSHYWQSIRNGESIPPFDQAVRAGHPRIRRYLYESSYARHLDSFMKRFDQSQMMVLLFDDLIQKPDCVISRALEHIGCDPSLAPTVAYEPVNQASIPRSRIVQNAVRTASRATRSVPMTNVMRRCVNRVGSDVRSLNTRWVTDVRMEDATRSYLQRQLGEDVRYVERMLDRDLSHWC